ncbi:NADH-quinone oxidoreductase subunit M [Methylosoma difficile]
MTDADFPLLSVLIALPLMGMLVLAACQHPRLAKTLALAFALTELLLAIVAVWVFNPDNEAFQLVESHVWIPSLNIQFLLGIDGISVLFLPMTALLTLLAMGASWHNAQLPRLQWALLLLLESMTMGVFSALDLVLFFLFWELTLPPIFFLMGLWGIGSLRRSAATKYTLFMLFGGAPLLLGIVLLAVNHASSVGVVIGSNLSFSLPVLLETALPDTLQTAVFLLLLLGFAVKIPLAPFHTWLPSAAMEAPSFLAALLMGLKLGVYGIIRFAMPLAPSAAVEYSWLLGIFGAITLIYAALIALRQTNLRSLLAYSSISHVGLVVVGVSSLNMQGLQGALLQLLNFSVLAASLMLIAGFLHHRLGSTEQVHLGGLAKVMPKLTCCYFLLAVASIGMPGTSGFPAELLMLVGALQAHPSLGIMGLVAAVLAAASFLSFTRRAFLGPVSLPRIAQLYDLVWREKLLLVTPMLLVLAIGFFPNTALHVSQKSIVVWLTRLLAQPKLEGEVADSR